MGKLIIVNKYSSTVGKDESNPVINVEPLYPSGVIHPDEDDLNEKERKFIALQEAAERCGFLLPTMLNRKVNRGKTNLNFGVKPLLPNLEY